MQRTPLELMGRLPNMLAAGPVVGRPRRPASLRRFLAKTAIQVHAIIARMVLRQG